MRDLRGATALVTGATGGIGSAVARALAAKGMEVVVSGRNEEQLAALERELGARPVRADLSDLSQVETLAAAAEPVDVLVSNAGVEQYLGFLHVEPDELERIVRLNLTAGLLLVRQLLPGMLERGRGHVVSMSSLAGHAYPAYQVGYATTKAGQIAFTRALRAEFRESPVGFSVVSPSFVTGAGMHANELESIGLKAPFPPGSVSPERVARAVVRAIERDLPEVLVAPAPIRPLMALDALSPRLGAAIVRVTGVNELFRKAARSRR